MLSKNVPFWSVPTHIFETSGWNTITFGSENVREKGLLLSEPALKVCIRAYLGLAIVFIDEYNPSKIFKIASNSFDVRDVPFLFVTLLTVAKGDTLCSD